jgi:hypothetical protein
MASGVILGRMDLHAYLTKHDGKPRSDGPELIRLALTVKRSAYYLYLTALGHKRVSDDTAAALRDASVDGELTEVNRGKKAS